MSCTQLCLLDTVLEYLPHSIALFNPDGRVAAANRRFISTHWYVHDLDQGTTIAEIISSASAAGCFLGDPDEYVAALKTAMNNGVTLSSEREFGDGRTVLITNTPTGEGGWVTCQADITARVEAERRVAFLARHDSLTELPNRVEYQERLLATIAEREAAGEAFAVLCLDFDRFKEVNDRFGHAFGDAFLREVARRMRLAAQGEVAARMGGDEFNMICGGAVDVARALCERLHSEVAGPVEIGGRRAVAALSIGVAAFPRDGSDPATLLNHADRALYRAKREGRGMTRFYDPASDRSVLTAA